jgi:hypothetical protein
MWQSMQFLVMSSPALACVAEGSTLWQRRQCCDIAARGRAQTFWRTTGLAVLLAGGLVVLALRETDAERKARAKRDQEDYRNAVCKQGKKECAEAQEEGISGKLRSKGEVNDGMTGRGGGGFLRG